MTSVGIFGRFQEPLLAVEDLKDQLTEKFKSRFGHGAKKAEGQRLPILPDCLTIGNKNSCE